MDSETQKIIDEQLKILPADVKAAIVSVDYQTKLQEITKRQRLLIDQAGKLEMETTLVMIGLEPLTDYIANLERELGLNTIRAKEVAMDVSENIFKPIRESLKTMNEAALKEEQATSVEEKPENEPPTTKFTNTNEINLNRDQILKEIEDPSLISKKLEVLPKQALEIPIKREPEIPPKRELEVVPGEEVKDLTKGLSAEKNLFETKMTGSTITNQEVVNLKPETKLPEVKKKSIGGFDPYRESIE